MRMHGLSGRGRVGPLNDAGLLIVPALRSRGLRVEGTWDGDAVDVYRDGDGQGGQNPPAEKLSGAVSVLRAPWARRELPPVHSRGRWIAWGVALQVIGVGIPVVAAVQRAHEDGVVGGITHYTVRLVWHEMLRSGADVALIVLGVVLFALGAVVLARPFVRRNSTLLIAVPLAAVAGFLVLGVLALVGAAVIAAAQGDAAAGDTLTNLIPGTWPGRRRRS